MMVELTLVESTNGVLDWEGAKAANGGHLIIGGRNNGEYTGLIDEVAIWML